MSEDLGEGTLEWLREAIPAERISTVAMPDLEALPKDLKSFAINLFGEAPGEEAIVALFTFLTACVHYEEKVLEVNPELALAGRERLEKNLQRLDKFFEDLFG